MTYRPQFGFPKTPRGFRDEQFHYSFDGTNVPLLAVAQAIAAGGRSDNIILELEPDAVFMARALKIQLGTAASTLNFQLKTPHGDYMQTVAVPLALFAGGQDGIAVAGQLCVAFDDEIECPAGSNWTLYLYNPTTGSVNPPAVTLFGVKRWDCRNEVRRAA